MTDQSKSASTAKGHCYQCGGERTAHIRGQHHTDWSNDEEGMWGSDKYFILECGGCEAIYFRHDSEFSEHDGSSPPKYWPSPVTRKPPQWLDDIELLDELLHQLLTEMYAAANNDLRVLAAIGARTAFDRASKLLRVPAHKSFRDKLAALLAKGKIGTDDAGVLGTLVDAGSAAAHRAWQPKASELTTMIDVLEAFVYRSLVLGKDVRKLKASVPKRNKR